MNSRQKGARGEREWRDELRARGYTARRGQQYNGLDGEDVVCEELSSRFHFEVKRTECLSLYDAMKQAERDAGERVPVVAHRRNGQEWVVIMRAGDWLDLVAEALPAEVL